MSGIQDGIPGNLCPVFFQAHQVSSLDLPCQTRNTEDGIRGARWRATFLVFDSLRTGSARAMKLLTHNMLMSPGTKNGYPLAIEVEKMETVEAEFNGEFTARMVEKLDYAALLSTLRSVSDAGFSAREHVAGTAVCSCL